MTGWRNRLYALTGPLYTLPIQTVVRPVVRILFSLPQNGGAPARERRVACARLAKASARSRHRSLLIERAEAEDPANDRAGVWGGAPV